MLREGQVLFTYLHLAASERLTLDLVARKVVAIAYETIQLADGSLPLLLPMSEIAGRMAPRKGRSISRRPTVAVASYLRASRCSPGSGRGSRGRQRGIQCRPHSRGYGGLGHDSRHKSRKLRAADIYFRGAATTMIADGPSIRKALNYADLVIGAVLVPGARAPLLINRGMLKNMKKGSVLVDVAIDQGGCAETSRPTTHDDPIYIVDGVVHYSVANMPGAVPRTATRALTLNTLPYLMKIANQGWKAAALQDEALRKGINLAAGQITHKAVADALDQPYEAVAGLLT